MNKPLTFDNATDLNKVPSESYENIFGIYQNDNGQYFFNINRKIDINADNVDPDFVEYKVIDRRMPLTSISYFLYGTQHLWWLIVLLNKINPVFTIARGTVIAVVKKENIQQVLTAIKNQL